MAYTGIRTGPPPVSDKRVNPKWAHVPKKAEREKQAKIWRRNYENVIKMGQKWFDVVGPNKSLVLAEKLRQYLNHVNLDYNEHIVNKTAPKVVNKYFENHARQTQRIPKLKTFTDLIREARDEEKYIELNQKEVCLCDFVSLHKLIERTNRLN